MSSVLFWLCAVSTLVLSAGQGTPTGADGMIDVPMEDPMQGSEMDALMKASSSDRVKGMDVVGRKVSPDGKSGMIQFGNPNAEKTKWTPSHVVSGRELLRTIENHDFVLAYFFSSEEDELSTSHTNGKDFEEAAQKLLESEEQVMCLMVDYSKMDPQDAAADFGVSEPHEYVLFKGSKPSKYTGPKEAKGIVAFMSARSGPPVRKITNAEDLEAALADASAVAATVVMAAFTAGYEGGTSKTAFHTKAAEIRDPMRLRFIETTFKTANSIKRLAVDTPFGGYDSAYVVLPPAAWLAKNETQYHMSTDFRKIFGFVRKHAFPTVMPNSEAFRKHSQEILGKQLLATVLYDTQAYASKHRYILKQLHKLIGSDEALAATYAFAIAERYPMDPYLGERFDRTTIGKQFYADFANDYPMKDFTLIVSNMSADTNWLDAQAAGSTPDGFDPMRFKDLLSRIADRKVTPLPQKEAAAAAAGLHEMSMGFGPNGMETKTTGLGGPKKVKNPKKKKKAKKAAPKDEV